MKNQLLKIVENRPTQQDLGYRPEFEDFRNE